MKRCWFLLLILFITFKVESQLTLYPRIDLTAAITFGSQNNKLGLFGAISGVLQTNKVALEGSSGVGVDFFLSKYGVFVRRVKLPVIKFLL